MESKGPRVPRVVYHNYNKARREKMSFMSIRGMTIWVSRKRGLYNGSDLRPPQKVSGGPWKIVHLAKYVIGFIRESPSSNDGNEIRRSDITTKL